MYVEASVRNQSDMGFVLLWMKVTSLKKAPNISGETSSPTLMILRKISPLLVIKGRS